MRVIPGYPDPNKAEVEPSGKLTWKGAQVEVDSLSVTRSFGTGLPSGVAGVDDLVASTGSASWALDSVDVKDGLHLPWNNSKVPRRGESVILEMGYSGVNDRVLTGVISSPAGRVTEGTVSVELVDHIDRLNREFSMDPVYYRQPSPIAGSDLMDIGLHPAFVTDRILRRCGYYATPPRSSGGFMNAPMMGSLWPETGTLEYGRSAVDRPATYRATYPEFTQTSFGLGLKNGVARYRPSSATRTFTSGLYFHWITGPITGSGSHRVRVEFANGTSVGVWLGASTRQVTIEAYDSAGVATQTRNFILDGGTSSRDNEISVWITPAGGVSLRVNDQTFSASSLTVGHGNTAVKLVHVQVDTATMWLAGLKVGMNASLDLHAWNRNAILEVSSQEDQQLAAVPAIVKRSCLELLKEQAKSELAGMWLDQQGRFRYRSRDKLTGAASSYTLTLDSIEDIQWSGAAAAGEVTVKWLRPYVTRSNRPWVTVNESSSATIRPGEVWETIVHPDGDSDWINVAPLGVLDTAQDEQDFNRGIGSWVAGILESDTTGVTPTSAASYLLSNASMTKLDAKSYLLRVDGSTIPAGRQLVLNTAEWSGLAQSKRGASTPVLRAYALVEWFEDQIPGLPMGNTDAGSYEHHAQWWIQNVSFAGRIADWIAQGLVDNLPVMHDIPVTPDDRRELGDVCTVNLGSMSLKCLTVGIQDSVSAEGREQFLTLQVIGVL